MIYGTEQGGPGEYTPSRLTGIVVALRAVRVHAQPVYPHLSLAQR
jgi:hypothetical protein